MRREGESRECATAIWFLLSEDASYINGQNLNVSGGQVNWGRRRRSSAVHVPHPDG